MMTIFEPLFILCFLATVVTLIAAAVSAIRGNRARAVTSLKKLGICAAVYLAALLAVGAASQRKVYRVGDRQCFDDWCITVTGAARTAPRTVEVALQLSSRAKQRPMGEKGTVAYLVDAQGRRYDPIPGSVTVSFETKLQPGESVTAIRRFDVPPDAGDLSFVYAHVGANFSPVIGENEFFQGAPLVRLEMDGHAGQLPEGLSARSMTRTSTGLLAGSSFNPNCSGRATKIEGGASDLATVSRVNRLTT
jgi:hypothetical protein